MNKKIITIIPAAALALSLSACAGGSNSDGKSPSYSNGFGYGQNVSLETIVNFDTDIRTWCSEAAALPGTHPGVDDADFSSEEWVLGCEDGFYDSVAE